MFNFAYAGTLPVQGTDVATRWDALYTFLVAVSAVFYVAIIGAMIYYAVKYKARPGLKPKYITGSHLLEGIFVVFPTILLMVIFGWGYSVYHDMTQAPSDAMEIRVIGKQWLWNFQYDNGRTTTNEVYVPLNKPVKLVMTSEDVLHAFFIPAFRVKQDVVPGMYSSVWFEAKVPGKHQVFCAEYCGTSHSQMLAHIIVLDDEDWKAWVAGKKLASADAQSGDAVATSQAAPKPATLSLVEQGKGIYQTKGCVACHSVDGSSRVGPSFKGSFGAHAVIADGSKVLRDENYIRESIEKPQAKLVKGFGGTMPTFQGLVSETEMTALIAYIKSLK